MSDDLEKRLRDIDADGRGFISSVNPPKTLFGEAADELARLRSENEALKGECERLREALYRIAITDDADCRIANDARAMTLIARAALKGAAK